MFYSHELLTSQKHGVATVWLVATLGAQSGLRRLNRRVIQGVDIEKACATVSESGAPLALRLQSNLLYGISRVYFKQCEYVLVDAQQARNSLLTLWKVVESHGLDSNAGKTKPENLVVQDEPGFLPDDAIPDPDLDPAMFESSAVSSSLPSLLSPRLKLSSGSELSALGLEIPSSISGGARDSLLPMPLPSAGHGSYTGLAWEENEGFDPNVDFGFDQDGNLLEYHAATPQPQASAAPAVPGSDTASTRIRRTFEDDLPTGMDWLNMEIELPPPRTSTPPPAHDVEPLPQLHQHDDESAMPPRTRVARPIPMDRLLQLRTSELVAMHEHYRANMAAAKQSKNNRRAAHQARKNAAYYIVGRGLGDTGALRSGLAHPLARFAGDSLWYLLTGSDLVAGRKRRSSSVGSDNDDEEDAARRKRIRQPERGRAVTSPQPESLADRLRADSSVERGRDAPVLPFYDEHSSQMPWNQPPSSRGGSRPPSALHSDPQPYGSAPRRSTAAWSVRLGSSPPARVGTRAPSASPLADWGMGLGSDDSDGAIGAQSLAWFDDPAAESLVPSAKEPLSPSAAPAVDSQGRATAVLEADTARFLDFVTAQAVPLADTPAASVFDSAAGEAMVTSTGGALGSGDQGALSAGAPTSVDRATTLAALLPPAEYPAMVAAQGFMHVLTLASWGYAVVSQAEAYGEIWIGVGGAGVRDEAPIADVGGENTIRAEQVV